MNGCVKRGLESVEDVLAAFACGCCRAGANDSAAWDETIYHFGAEKKQQLSQ